MSSFGGGGSSASPTPQQVALQTEQATTNANLNLEENEQRKTILNALQGTRVFRGSALSRQIAGNQADTTGAPAPAAPSANQQSPKLPPPGGSLLDENVLNNPSAQTALATGRAAANAA